MDYHHAPRDLFGVTRAGAAPRYDRFPEIVQVCPPPSGALEGKGPQRRFDRQLEGVAKAVGGGYCRLQMPLRLALAVRGTVAGHRLGALEGGGGGNLPPFQCIPGLPAPPPNTHSDAWFLYPTLIAHV